MDLNYLYDILALGDIDKALDFIFREIDRLLSVGQLTSVDAILAAIDFEKLDLDSQLGFLTATLPVKEYLKNREAFYQKVKQFIKNELKEDTAALLSGLK